MGLILAGLPATVNPNLSINENCLAGLPPGSAEAEWLETILRDLHLLKVRDYPICSLGPAAQRLAGFACALVWSPPIVILDEPLAEFEPDVVQMLKYWLVKLVYKYNKTVVIATRDPTLVEELCDEVALLNRGRLITQQPVMALLGSTTGARYQIRVQGHLSADWSDWFDNLAITNTENGETVISGIIRDQAALYGVLTRIQNLALALLSVTRAELNLADIAAQLIASG